MVYRHTTSTALAMVAAAILFFAESTTAVISTNCLSVLPSLPICAQCPGQDILQMGNCATTDVAACVCHDEGLTSQFFDLLYQGCSPPNVKSISTYNKGAQKFISICAKDGYTISDSKHDGSASVAPSSSVPPFLSTSASTASVEQTASSVSHGSGTTKDQATNMEPTSSAGTGGVVSSSGTTPTPTSTSTSKANTASREFGVGIGRQMERVIAGMFAVVLFLLL